jgi:hypothetical protein
LYILTVLSMLATMEVGYRLTRARQRKAPAKGDAGVGSIVGASLALLAFLLAFVVSFGATIFNERRQLVMDEANAIGTTYLRAGYLNEPYKTEARDLLREYSGLRLSALDSAQLATAVTRSEQIHNELWTSAETIAREEPWVTTGLYLASLNEVIDLHSNRVSVGLGIRIAPTVLLGLHLVA